MKVMIGMTDLNMQISREDWAKYVNEVYPQFPASPWSQEKWDEFYRARGIEPPPCKPEYSWPHMISMEVT